MKALTDNNPGLLFARVMVPRPMRMLFTYSIPEELRSAVIPGARVVVPFGSAKLTGLVAEIVDHAEMETKPILQVVDKTPIIPADVLSLGLWTADHYFAPPGDVAQLLMPPVDDVIIDTDVELLENVPPPRSRKFIGIYEALVEKGGVRRLDLLASDLDITPAELKKILSGDAARKFVKLGRSSRMVSARARDEAERAALHPTPVELNDEQRTAFDKIAPDIESARFAVHLIHGVTGSGKTEVYVKLIEKTLAAGKTALALAPEIALADMLSERFKTRLGFAPVTLHSDMTPRERERRWAAARNGEAKLVVGARSAVFAPLPDLGLIIVDEEHDQSYKQETAPRYSGRDVAIKRAAMNNIPIVLGSATPSLESYYHATTGKYGLIELRSRVSGRPLPPVVIVQPEKKGHISHTLAKRIAQRLENHEQSLLFINRRGFARYAQCATCGYVIECRNCSLSLVYHEKKKILRCHTCGYEIPAPDTCEKCGSPEFYLGGSGSEKIEKDVAAMFPTARIARMDKDTTSRRRASATILSAMENRDVDILIGTQMITKGHDYPSITLVGAINADDALHIPDFRAGERCFQLLTQAGGRAGRGEREGLVVAQTFSETHHSVTAAARHDYKMFYETEMELRRAVGYPPFTRLAFIRFDAPKPGQGEEFIIKTAPLLKDIAATVSGLTILGPVESVVFRARNRYHWRILLKAPSHGVLYTAMRRFFTGIESIKYPSTVRMTVDMDPFNMM